jgi:tRNA threonylcarbamoyladenosine biosynthesis protein TsaB
MRVLAIDTTTARGSVALLDDEVVRGEVCVTAAEGHSRWLFPAIERLLSPVGGPSGVTGLAVTLGPGSFTGLRVGIAAVQGLALGAAKPCVGISALDVLASLVSPSLGPVVAIMDAWRGEVYACVYEGGVAQGAPFGGLVEEVAARLPERAVLIGDGVARHADRLRTFRPDARLQTEEAFLAVPLARLALEALRARQGIGPEALTPLYIRGADIRLPSR